MGKLSHIIDDGLLLNFCASSGYLPINLQFSRIKALVEKSVCKHGMSRRKIVIIMASLSISYQL